MRQRSALCAASILVAMLLGGCGGSDDDENLAVIDDADDAPVMLSAVTAALSGQQESPAAMNNGWGRSVANIRADRAGLSVTVAVSGLGQIMAVELRLGALGENGPVLFALAGMEFLDQLTVDLTAADLLPQPGSGINTLADAIAAILAGDTYIQVRTLTFPAGAIRGQLGPVKLTAQLSGASEVPPVTSAGAGSFTLTLTNLQDGFTFSMAATGITGLTRVDLRLGDPGEVGPVLFEVALAPALPLVLSGTALSDLFTPAPEADIRDLADALNAMLTGRTYINLETTSVPDGELRGQLLP